MPTPKEVFDNPLQYLDFLQSADFERQYFDRKEVRTTPQNQISTLKKNIKECISAFANWNKIGGLLALGITNDGTLKGTQNANEQTINNILQVTRDLRNHATQEQEVEVPNSGGKRLYLLYTPWTSNAICETTADFPKAWKRVGAQNLALTEQDREQLKRDKRIVDFEMSYCCPYDPEELDMEVVAEFKKAFLEERGAQYGHRTEAVLDHIGALIKEVGTNNYAFTNVGYLFFASNPHKRLGGAFVRLLRYDVSAEDLKNPGGPMLNEEFYGPVPNIIQNLQSFLNQSTFIQSFGKPEYPFLTVFEALVNAVIHRDYGFTSPILCSAYKDKLIVKNPGGFLQSVPPRFSLADTVLDAERRNPRLVDWMRLMKDEDGTIFVRSLSEGTRSMLEAMQNARLPAPYYETGRNTTVTLYNQASTSASA